ncbi:hypothetical protein POM88_019622 [Heracleum sosnowskyi]|uniref:NTF2 domain-containing protein n=1 Tax=Heracleum sosnowskyi TaxID=360622 RepID=A0AAD8MR13_9APIA|nr:hypothetical protein POM88_019622 [Heracleum sosnowskyi]
MAPSEILANAFIPQYYNVLARDPGLLYKFYTDTSKFVRVEDDGSTSTTTTKRGINEKILSLNHGGKFAITSIDAQESPNMDVHILVTGSETGRDNLVRHFAQSFLLGPMENGTGYYLLHDMFRYVGNANQLVVGDRGSSGSNVDLHEPASDDLVRETSATTSMAPKFLEQMNKNDQHENKSDLCKYLSDTLVKEADPFDILNWWKTNSSKYPVLSEMARNVLSVPVSTVASESAFSTRGRILDSYRSSLRPKTVEALVCAQNWLRSKESMPDLRDVI